MVIRADSQKIAEQADFLIYRATSANYANCVNKDIGGTFIRSLCEVGA